MWVLQEYSKWTDLSVMSVSGERSRSLRASTSSGFTSLSSAIEESLCVWSRFSPALL